MAPQKTEGGLAGKLLPIGVTNITNPLIWVAVALLVALCGLAPFEATRPFAYMVGGLLCADLLVFYAAYVFFGLTDPDRLQSETHRIRVLDMTMKQQGKANARVIDIQPPVPNPETPALTSQVKREANPANQEQTETVGAIGQDDLGNSEVAGAQGAQP